MDTLWLGCDNSFKLALGPASQGNNRNHQRVGILFMPAKKWGESMKGGIGNIVYRTESINFAVLYLALMTACLLESRVVHRKPPGYPAVRWHPDAHHVAAEK
jgi:hypothetical protein